MTLAPGSCLLPSAERHRSFLGSCLSLGVHVAAPLAHSWAPACLWGSTRRLCWDQCILYSTEHPIHAPRLQRKCRRVPILCTWTPARITAGFLELGRSSERLSLDSHPGLGSTECVATCRSPVSALAQGSSRDISPFAAWIPRIKTPFQSRKKYKQHPLQIHFKSTWFMPQVSGMNLTEASKGPAHGKSLPAGPLGRFSSDRPPSRAPDVPPPSGACLAQAPTGTSWELHAGSYWARGWRLK